MRPPLPFKLLRRTVDTSRSDKKMSKAQRTSTYLVLRLGDEPERAIVWDTIEISIGRLDDQDIEVPDPEVSRKHALLRRDGERFVAEDLGTGLGTLVNGERITTRELEHGDVIEIGKLALRFGQTNQPIRPGPNVRFASELKGGNLPVLDREASGRTMLAFDAVDELLPSAAAAASGVSGARAVSADGSLEALDADDPLGLSFDAMDLGSAPAPRDLDLELDEKPEAWAAAAPTRAPLPPVGSRAVGAGGHREHAGAQPSVELALLIDGPAQEVSALVGALRDTPIQIGSLRLRIRERR